MESLQKTIDEQAIKVVRGIAMDAPRQANSGHSGTAMALAPLAHVLFSRVMHHDPADPGWPDRDRFVLSCGHAAILLYSYLYLCGYGLELDDLRKFRQWGSRTPGHPERELVRGAEVTTGPLGQGFGNSVGMAIAERVLRTRFGSDLVDHHVFVLCSDGDLQEGVSHEAASLAGHLGLGHIVAVFDDNHITIDGSTTLSSSDDVAKRFEAYGWHTEHLGELANDTDALEAAVRRAMAVEDRPSLLVLRSHIGWPAPNLMDTSKAHGDPFPSDEITRTKEILGLPADTTFWAPDDVVTAYREHAAKRGADARSAWQARFDAWTGDKAVWAASWESRGLPGWEEGLPRFDAGEKLATRQAIGKALNACLDTVPGLVAGGADLTGNTGTKLDDQATQSVADPGGRQLHFGIREFGMGTALNGMAAHGGVIPVGGTFFVFSDYERPAVRLAALSEVKSVFVFTHDSVGLGEDGPTHQPVEQLAGLRAMPNLHVVRPADANETVAAWVDAVHHSGPTALVLSRQATPTVTDGSAVARGAAVVRAAEEPQVVLLATGTEVATCVAAAEQLAGDGVAASVVSMPSWDRFEQQDRGYQQSVLPPGVPVLSVEAAATFGWDRWADAMVGIDRFGASAPGTVALEQLGINVDNVVAQAKALLEGKV
jgi:transketolase